MTVTHACADCLEQAGGRQQRHRIDWQLGSCGACGRERAVTAPANFGSPRLVHTTMENVMLPRACRICGCTDDDCRGCIRRIGQPCYWVETDLCSACEVRAAE